MKRIISTIAITVWAFMTMTIFTQSVDAITESATDINSVTNISTSVDIELKSWDYSTYDSPLACIEDNLVITIDGESLYCNTDYSIDSIDINKSDQKVICFDIRFQGKYSGTVLMRCLDYAEPIPSLKEQYYTGQEIRPEVNLYVMLFATPVRLIEGKHYVVEYENNINHGMATMKIKPAITAYGSKEFNFRICNNIEDAEINIQSTVPYTGKAVEPEIELIYQGKPLIKNIDYKVSYWNNIGVGTGELLIEGIGLFGGDVIGEFEIVEPIRIDERAQYHMKKWDYSNYSSMKDCVEDNLEVSLEGNILKAGADYRIESVVGREKTREIMSFDVVFTGHYKGTAMLQHIDYGTTINLSDTYFYTGKEIKPLVSVYGNGANVLSEATDYHLAYDNNVAAGTATVRITGKNRYFGIKNVSFKIVKDFTNVKVEELSNKIFTGERITPSVNVSYEGKKLVKGIDYIVEYSNNVNAGTATVKLKGIGEYNGTIIKKFQITPIEVSNRVTWKLDKTNVAGYTSGMEFARENLHLMLDGRRLVEEKEFSFISVGYMTEQRDITSIHIKLIGNYRGELRIRNLTYMPMDLPLSDTYHHTGNFITPILAKQICNSIGEVMVEGKDYVIEYFDNINPGTATVKITGIGNYFGFNEKTFEITDHEYIVGTKIEATCTTPGKITFVCPYAGCTATKVNQIATIKHRPVEMKAIAPSCTETGLTAGTKCSVCYAILQKQETIAAIGHNLHTLSAEKATLNKAGKTEGKMCSTCGVITVAQKPVNKIKTVKLSTKEYTYNGQIKSPRLIIKDEEGMPLQHKTDYIYEKPSDRKNIGKYTYKITFIGNYAGSKSLSFTIKPAKISIKAPKATKKTVTVKWTKGKKAQVTGYQVMIATDSKFKRNKKTATVKGYSKVSRKMTKLKAKTKYYVKVRSYKTIKGVKLYSDWSKVKTIKTK